MKSSKKSSSSNGPSASSGFSRPNPSMFGFGMGGGGRNEISVIPRIDHGRVHYFVDFWLNLGGMEMPRDQWMLECCKKLDKYNWPER